MTDGGKTLRLVAEARLWQGWEDLGLSLHVERECRLPTLTPVRGSDGKATKAIARTLRLEHQIEVDRDRAIGV